MNLLVSFFLLSLSNNLGFNVNGDIGKNIL